MSSSHRLQRHLVSTDERVAIEERIEPLQANGTPHIYRMQSADSCSTLEILDTVCRVTLSSEYDSYFTEVMAIDTRARPGSAYYRTQEYIRC